MNRKISQILSFLFFFSIPTQLGKHFWFTASLVLGRRIDYLSPTFYFTDAVFLGCLMFLGLDRQAKLKKGFVQLIVSIFLLIYLFYLVIFQHLLTAYFLLRTIELLSVMFLFKIKVFQKEETIYPLILGTLVTSVFGICQFLSQHSSGWGYLLGERNFTNSSPGIAQVLINSKLMLRPYATFSHPNVWAGFLLVLLPLLISLDISDTNKIINVFKYLLRQLTIALSLLGIILSFSRTAWVGLLLLGCYWVIKQGAQSHTPKLFFIVLFIFVIEELSWGRFLSALTFDAQSLLERTKLTNTAVTMYKSAPLLGVGLGNFISEIPKYQTPPFILQPVHSIYLLLLSETGTLGTIIVVILLWLLIRSRWKKLSPELMSLCLILFLGLFDHYFFTIKQTQWMFAFIAGLLML